MSRVSCSLVALMLVGGSPAAADPLTVTSGFVIFTDEPGEFAFGGAGFDVRGLWFPRLVSGTFWHDACAPCLPGTAVDFGTTTYFFSTDFNTIAQGSVDGVAYDALFYDALVTFRGPHVIAPAFNPSDHTLASGAFEFDGSLALYADASQSGAPLFSAILRGSGTADVFFGSGGDGRLLDLNDLVYRFEEQAPVPEPATLLLLGTGLAALAARRRTRTR